jgi:hypothetical protein
MSQATAPEFPLSTITCDKHHYVTPNTTYVKTLHVGSSWSVRWIHNCITPNRIGLSVVYQIVKEARTLQCTIFVHIIGTLMCSMSV